MVIAAASLSCLLVVCHCARPDSIRIISSRKARELLIFLPALDQFERVYAGTPRVIVPSGSNCAAAIMANEGALAGDQQGKDGTKLDSGENVSTGFTFTRRSRPAARASEAAR